MKTKTITLLTAIAFMTMACNNQNQKSDQNEELAEETSVSKDEAKSQLKKPNLLMPMRLLPYRICLTLMML